MGAFHACLVSGFALDTLTLHTQIYGFGASPTIRVVHRLPLFLHPLFLFLPQLGTIIEPWASPFDTQVLHTVMFFLFISFPLLYQFLVVIVEIPFIVNKVSEVVATLQKTANKLANMTPSNFGLSSSSNPTSNFIIAPSTRSSSASNYTLSTFGPSTPSSTASCSALNNSGPSVQRSTPLSVQRSTPPSECDTFGFGVSILKTLCLF